MMNGSDFVLKMAGGSANEWTATFALLANSG